MNFDRGVSVLYYNIMYLNVHYTALNRDTPYVWKKNIILYIKNKFVFCRIHIAINSNTPLKIMKNIKLFLKLKRQEQHPRFFNCQK